MSRLQDVLTCVMTTWPAPILHAMLVLTLEHIHWMNDPADLLRHEYVPFPEELVLADNTARAIPAGTDIHWIDLLDWLAAAPPDVRTQPAWLLWTRVALVAAQSLSVVARFYFCVAKKELIERLRAHPTGRERYGRFLRPFLESRMTEFAARRYTDPMRFLQECIAFHMFHITDAPPFVLDQLACLVTPRESTITEEEKRASDVPHNSHRATT